MLLWFFEWRPERLPTPTSFVPGRASSSAPWPTSASWKITSAAAISFSALRVSKSGSPGPAPTNHTSPRRMSSGGMLRPPLLLEKPSDRRAARAAIGAGTKHGADLSHGREAAVGNGGENGLRPHVEADADDRAFVRLCAGRAAREHLWTL